MVYTGVPFSSFTVLEMGRVWTHSCLPNATDEDDDDDDDDDEDDDQGSSRWQLGRVMNGVRVVIFGAYCQILRSE